MTLAADETTGSLFAEIKHTMQRRFLIAFVQVGRVSRATAAAGICPATHYNWLDDPTYAAAFAKAEQLAASLLEDEAWRRAVQGVERAVYQRGQMVGTQTEYSDGLLQLLLRGNRPSKYREPANQQQVLVMVGADQLQAARERAILGGGGGGGAAGVHVIEQPQKIGPAGNLDAEG